MQVSSSVVSSETLPVQHTHQPDDYPDHRFDIFRKRLADTIKYNLDKDPESGVFRTDATGVFEAFLAGIPEETRGHYTCSCCRKFIERYLCLVAIEKSGRQRSLVSPEDGDVSFFGFYQGGIQNIMKLVSKAKITGVFRGFGNNIIGTPSTGKWTHMYADIGIRRIESLPRHLSEKKLDDVIATLEGPVNQSFQVAQNSLNDYSKDLVAKALALVKSDAMANNHLIMNPLVWFNNLHTAIAENKGQRENLVWRAISTTKPGVANIRSSLVATLLDDLKADMPVEKVKSRFIEKTDPTRYRRMQAEATAGQIKVAEKRFADIGGATALERRFARIDDMKLFWAPKPQKPNNDGKGLFGHLNPDEKKTVVEAGSVSMSVNKFMEKILPGVTELELLVPMFGPFFAFTTAVHDDAIPILKWDKPDDRYPVLGFCYHVKGPMDRINIMASTWNLKSGEWVKVTGLCVEPLAVRDGAPPDNKKCRQLFFLLENCRLIKDESSPLFPEALTDDLHDVRTVIEKFGESKILQGRQEASACGLGMARDANYTGIYGCDTPFTVRVVKDGVSTIYKLDRFE